jgi:hypothetical protein
MPSLRRVALPLLCLALAGVLAWHWATPSPAPASPQPADPPAPAAAAAPDPVAPHESATAPAPATPEATPLPLPADLAALLARADAGDVRAACQLGTRLLACAHSDWYRDQNFEGMRRAEREALARGDVAGANDAAKFLLAGAQARQACGDVPPALRARASGLIRQAALGGEPEAIVRYATGQALLENHLQPHAFLRSPNFDTWRSEAPTLLAALEQSGDPQAVLAMLTAVGEHNNLALIMPPDPVRDAATLALARRLFGDHKVLRNIRLPNRPTADQAREAEALAAAWHRDRFAGRRFRIEEHTAALTHPLAVTFDGGWPQPSVTAPGCFETSFGAAP